MSSHIEKDGSWTSQFRYSDYNGNMKEKHKRGFRSKEEADAFEEEFLSTCSNPDSMTFEEFVAHYYEDNRPRVRESSWKTKQIRIDLKIAPFFEKKRLNEITPKDVMRWQNWMKEQESRFGKPYSQATLRAYDEVLCTLFNHAVRYYGLASNPAKRVTRMGGHKVNSMMVWNCEEYRLFSEAIANKPKSYYAFEMLYWTGIREGELLALTPADFDFEASTVSITKTKHTNGDKAIAPPKTEKSYRTIAMPQFLAEEMREYIELCLDIADDELIFPISKSYLHHEMDRGCKISGVKRIRIHDLRHSHVSLLIKEGFTAAAIADRVGHESQEITFRYAHLFAGDQERMAEMLDKERKEGLEWLARTRTEGDR